MRVIARLHLCGPPVAATVRGVSLVPLLLLPLPPLPPPLLGALPPTDRIPATRLDSETGRIRPI